MLFAERVRRVLIEAQEPGAPHPVSVIQQVYERSWPDESVREFLRDVTAVIACAQPMDVPPVKRLPKKWDIWKHGSSGVEWQLVAPSRLYPGMWIIERQRPPADEGEQPVSVCVVSEPHWEFIQ